MLGRTILHMMLAIALFPAFTGCKGKPAPKMAGPPPLRPSLIAKHEMLDIAKKIEDPAATEQIQFYVASFEDPEKGWSLSDLDEYILRGGYSIQTKIAYDTYRRMRILESKK